MRTIKMKNFIYITIALFFFNKNLNALTFNNDSLKNKYELNDPRNPNCPCHKYQKLADEEFEKLLRQPNSNANGIANKNTIIQTQTSVANAKGRANMGNTFKSNRFKNLIFYSHTYKSFKIFNFNKGTRCKKRHHVRSNKNISSCFGWR